MWQKGIVYKPLKCQKQKIAEFANIVDPDEVAHNEPPHLGLHCLNALQCLEI